MKDFNVTIGNVTASTDMIEEDVLRMEMGLEPKEQKDMIKMKEFKSIEELKNDESLKNMGRYCWEKVKLEGKEVFACTTNQQYEDIIWGGIYEMLNDLFKYYEVKNEPSDLSSDIRDFVLEKLEEEGIEFVDVYDEY